jgi:hypothetical protein
MVPAFGIREVVNTLNQFTEQCERDIIELFQYVGERVVNDARNNGTYQNRTGNLRSSIGYVIVINGDIVERSFPGKKKDGTSIGNDTAEQLALKYNKGINLIVVAGMEYAAAVETTGRDVLTGSIPSAAELINTLSKELGISK